MTGHTDGTTAPATPHTAHTQGTGAYIKPRRITATQRVTQLVGTTLSIFCVRAYIKKNENAHTQGRFCLLML